MPTAFPNISGPVFTADEETIQKGFDASRKSKRKRIILPVHRRQDAPVQRMYNFLQPGTYIRPHFHPRPFASESICVLKGSITFFVFDYDGNIISKYSLHAENPVHAVIDIESDVWHSFIVNESDTLIYETKKGPYSLDSDKIFADWAPEEFSKEAEAFVKELSSLN